MSFLCQKHLKLTCLLISMSTGGVTETHTPGVVVTEAVTHPQGTPCAHCGFVNQIPQYAPYGVNMPYAVAQPFVLPFYYVVPVVQPFWNSGYSMINYGYPPLYDFLDDEGLARFDSEFSGLHNSYHVKRIQHLQPTITVDVEVNGEIVPQTIPNDGSVFGNGMFAIEEKNTWLGRVSDRILGYRVNWFSDNYMNSYQNISPFDPIHKGIFFRRTRNFQPLNWDGISFENRFNQLIYGNPLQPGQQAQPGTPLIVAPPGPGAPAHPAGPHAPIEPVRPAPLIAGVYPMDVVGTEPPEVRVRIHPEWIPNEMGSPILVARPVEEPKDLNLIFRVKIPRERREIYA